MCPYAATYPLSLTFSTRLPPVVHHFLQSWNVALIRTDIDCSSMLPCIGNSAETPAVAYLTPTFAYAFPIQSLYAQFWSPNSFVQMPLTPRFLSTHCAFARASHRSWHSILPISILFPHSSLLPIQFQIPILSLVLSGSGPAPPPFHWPHSFFSPRPAPIMWMHATSPYSAFRHSPSSESEAATPCRRLGTLGF